MTTRNKEYEREYYKKNREKILNRSKEYYRANKERVKPRMRQYYYDHKEKWTKQEILKKLFGGKE
jgi:hypothetical protein